MKTYNRPKITTLTFIIVVLAAAIVLTGARSAGAATWTQKADMPTPRWGHSAAVVNGKIYVIGGVASEPSFLGGKELSAVEEYDPATDTWTRKADMPAPRGYLTISNPVVDGKIYVIGGGKSGSSRVDLYDPVMDTWSRGADMPTARVLQAAVACDGKIYAFGGLSTLNTPVSSLQALNITEVFDPKTDTWAEAAPMPYAVWQHSADEVNDKIYVVGGASNVNAMRLLQVYDPQTDAWANATPMPLSTRGFGATAVCGSIYAIGGWLNSGQRPYSDTWVYDQTSDTWTEAAPLPDFRAGLTTSAVNGRIYAIGGTPKSHNCQATSTVYELDLELGFPQPDLNGDGIVDSADIIILIDHWHTDEPSCDIAPAPCGDGIIDVQDLILLSEHLFEDNHLIAHWMLDETEGNVAYDSAAKNDAVVIGDATWQPEGGQVDGALQFDGVSSYLSAPFILDPAKQPFSVFAWVEGGQPGQTIISQQGAFMYEWLGLDAEGALTSTLTLPLASVTSNAVLTDDQWHHIGLVSDGSGISLYVDDVEIARSDISPVLPAIGGLQIGAGKNLEPASFWSGLIDDVRIYDRTIVP